MDKITGANRRLAKKRVKCLSETLCFVSSSEPADNLLLRNPLLRQALKRYATFSQIRDHLIKLNIRLKDTKVGAEWAVENQ